MWCQRSKVQKDRMQPKNNGFHQTLLFFSVFFIKDSTLPIFSFFKWWKTICSRSVKTKYHMNFNFTESWKSSVFLVFVLLLPAELCCGHFKHLIILSFISRVCGNPRKLLFPCLTQMWFHSGCIYYVLLSFLSPPAVTSLTTITTEKTSMTGEEEDVRCILGTFSAL